MAHSCPECDQACYCGGDIDDILMEDTEEEMGCTHCPVDGCDDSTDYDEFDEEGPEPTPEAE